MKDNQCRECVPPKRYPGCHADCEAYISWKAEWDALKDEIRKQKQIEDCARPIKPKRRRY